MGAQPQGVAAVVLQRRVILEANMRELNNVDKEIQSKLEELRLFVAKRWKDGAALEQGGEIDIEVVSDVKMTWSLLEDINTIEHIWTKDKGTI